MKDGKAGRRITNSDRCGRELCIGPIVPLARSPAAAIRNTTNTVNRNRGVVNMDRPKEAERQKKVVDEAVERRISIIVDAAAEYDQNEPALKGLTTRKAWIDDALRQTFQGEMTYEEVAALERGELGQVTANSERESVIANSAREFDAGPMIQRVTNKAALIGLALRDKGHAPLSESERRLYV